VALGILQTQRSPWLAGLVMAGVAIVASLHLIAGLRERRHDDRGSTQAPAPGENWVDIGCVDDIADSRGSTVTVGNGERIAVFRHNGCISATTNVCAHQGGRLHYLSLARLAISPRGRPIAAAVQREDCNVSRARSWPADRG
jgi:hypothetical protein